MSSQSRILQVESTELFEFGIDNFDWIATSSSSQRVSDTNFMRSEREDEGECEEGRDADEQEHEPPARSWSYGHAGRIFVDFHSLSIVALCRSREQVLIF